MKRKGIITVLDLIVLVIIACIMIAITIPINNQYNEKVKANFQREAIQHLESLGFRNIQILKEDKYFYGDYNYNEPVRFTMKAQGPKEEEVKFYVFCAKERTPFAVRIY